MPRDAKDLLHGTLDLLVLRALAGVLRAMRRGCRAWCVRRYRSCQTTACVLPAPLMYPTIMPEFVMPWATEDE